LKQYKQEKNKNFRRIKEILPIVCILLAIGISGYFLSLALFAEAQVSLPFPTSPPLSCTGCHDFQARLFTELAYNHPNAISFPGPIDMVTQVIAVRQDCCACHNYQISHTGGIVMLKDPDPTDFFSYNGDPVQTNNFCLSCHDDPGKPVGFNSININSMVVPEDVVAPLWCLPCAHNKIGLRCLDCHKYHGSAYKDMLKLNQPNLCYMNGCHPEKAIEFHHTYDPLNESHHHVEGVVVPGALGPTTANIIDCCDCHNPHHNTTTYPISDPYSQQAPFNTTLYPVMPFKKVTLPVETILPPPTAAGLPVSILNTVQPFFVGETNAAGVPLADLFCLECHAPDIFIRPPDVSSAWLYAPNISYEIINKYWDPLKTTSNFFYSHGHKIFSKCSGCHIKFSKPPPAVEIINGHFTHMKNASCTYCHDPHGTPGTYAGGANVNVGGAIVGGILLPNQVSVQGIQRGHLLGEYLSPGGEVVKDFWLLTTSVNLLPDGKGYLAEGVYPSATSITSVDGASSCFANNRRNPLLTANGCHSISHIHTGLTDDNVNDAPVDPYCICNRVACHQPFTPLLARKGDKTEGGDTLAPAPPK